MMRELRRLVLCCLLSIGCLICAPNIYGAEKDKDEKISALLSRASYTESVRMSDDVVLSLHSDRPNGHSGAVLDIAKNAYEKIVFEFGFNREGFSISQNQTNCSQDKDRVIDIFILTGPLQKYAGTMGLLQGSLTPPCFDVINGSGDSVDAVVFLPENVWSLIDDKKAIDRHTLEGMLVHEMAHVVLYHYNKNVSAWNDQDYTRGSDSALFGKDWYAEGLARYFETLVGNYEHFFKGGYKEGEGPDVGANQDGVNYLADNPTEPFYKARYDYALFWAYIHDRYGMKKIEELSSDFRSIRPRDVIDHAPQIISRVLGVPFDELMHGFAAAIWKKDFDPRITTNLKDVNCKELNRNALVSHLDPWANDFVRIRDQKLIGKNSFNIEAEKGAVLSAWIVYNDGSRQESRINFNKEKNACRFQIPQNQIDNVSEIVLILTNRDDGNKIKISACSRET